MLNVNCGFFVQAPTDDERRVLCPATVTGIQDGVFIATVDDAEFDFAPDQEVLVFFEQRREFMQQPARIGGVAPTTAGLSITFQTTGNPVSAESRQCYRVCTVLTGGLVATLNNEQGCDVRDVSMTGFSAVGTTRLKVGARISAGIRYEDKTFTGTAVVQSICDLGDGRFRYGLHCPDSVGAKNELARGLQVISMAVQRTQLRRQAGAA